MIDDLSITLENGKTFRLIAKNNTTENCYIQKLSLNGKELKEPRLRHEDIMNGGILEFEMGSKPIRNYFVKP
jgi:putative alpha-1,2-mannosidase